MIVIFTNYTILLAALSTYGMMKLLWIFWICGFREKKITKFLTIFNSSNCNSKREKTQCYLSKTHSVGLLYFITTLYMKKSKSFVNCLRINCRCDQDGIWYLVPKLIKVLKWLLTKLPLIMWPWWSLIYSDNWESLHLQTHLSVCL